MRLLQSRQRCGRGKPSVPDDAREIAAPHNMERSLSHRRHVPKLPAKQQKEEHQRRLETFQGLKGLVNNQPAESELTGVEA